MFVPGGGNEAVTAWTVEALRLEYQVSLITFTGPVTADALNGFYGTNLREDEFSCVCPNLPPLLKRTKRFSLLKDHLMMRYCKSARASFDLFICIGAGMDCGHRTVQYFGYKPVLTVIKEAARWHYFLKRRFMRLCEVLSGFSLESMKQNVTLVNSQWIGQVVEQVFAISNYEVVYPPVNASSVRTVWDGRREGFLCISRIVPYKRIERVIEIIRRVREQGFDVSLHVVGRPDDPDYFARISQLRQRFEPWLSLQDVVPNQELISLIDQYKYGIHGALDEPFGIAIAEMVKAGCIVFVPDGGGQTEIVGVPELTYESIDDAVVKITNVLGGKSLQFTLQNHLERQRDLFSTQTFCQTINRVVHEYFAHRVIPSSTG